MYNFKYDLAFLLHVSGSAQILDLLQNAQAS